MCSTTSVAGQPGVAVDQPLARSPGEITNGGLVAIRSNRSSRDRLEEASPSRTSIGRRRSLSAALKPGQPQRPRVDVGGDDVRRRGAARCRAWTPQPVPRSSARATGSRSGQLGQGGRGRADAEHVVGADPDGLPVEAGGQVADDPEVAVRRWRTGARPGGRDLADRTLRRKPGVLERRPTSPGSARSACAQRRPASGAGTAGSASRAGSRRRVRRAGRASSRCGRAPSWAAGAEQLGDRVVGEAGRPGRAARSRTKVGQVRRRGSSADPCDGLGRPGPAVVRCGLARSDAARLDPARRRRAGSACTGRGRGRGRGGPGRRSPIATSRCLEM